MQGATKAIEQLGADGKTQGISEIKVVVVGDGGCGKTSLLMVFAKGEFPKVYVPTVFEKFSAPFYFSGKPVIISLWDTAGQEDYDRLRPLAYSGAHAIVMCYDVTNLTSFDNILRKWYPEVTHFCRGTPILLVGCKSDMRKDKVLLRSLHQDQQVPISYQKGERLAQRLHAVAYLECSARFQENITDIFKEVSKAALNIRKKHKHKLKRACLVS